MRQAAAGALGKIGDARAVEPLIMALRDPLTAALRDRRSTRVIRQELKAETPAICRLSMRSPKQGTCGWCQDLELRWVGIGGWQGSTTAA